MLEEKPGKFAHWTRRNMRALRVTLALLAGSALPAAAPAAPAAAPPVMAFARLGSDEGLSPGAILAINQDAQGFMWFGTEDGLDRYDGYELRHFIHSRTDAASLPNNWVAALARDSAGQLWVGSDGGGLVYRDAASGRFLRPAAMREPGLDPAAKIRAVHVDRAGRVWVATRNAGVYMIDLSRHETKHYHHEAARPESLGDDSVYAFEEDASGQIWLGTAAGLDSLDPRSGRIEHFDAQLSAAGVPHTVPAAVNTLLTDRRGNLWVGCDSGLVRIDAASAAVTFLRHRDGVADSLPNGRVTALLEDDEQRLWVGTSAGLALLDRRSDRFVVVGHDPTTQDSLPDSHITAIFQDRGGLLWVGTKTGGVARWNPRSWSFGHHRFGEEGADGVTSFALDSHGSLWIGSYGGGAASIDPATGVVTRYRRSRDSPLALRDDTVMAVLVDDRDRVWLGTMNHGIERIDATRHSITHFDYRAADPGSLPAPGVMSLLRDTRGRIWVGTYGAGVAMIDPVSDRVTRYDHGRLTTASLSGDRAQALAEDRTGLIWIGTDGTGVDVLDPASGRFVNFAHDPKAASSLSDDIVYALHMDDAGVMWVGTRAGGLDRVSGAPFGKQGLRFENLSEAEGLPNSTVYGIESDSSRRLWLSTNRGLAVLDPDDRRVRVYRRSHGLQADEFNFGAHYRGPDGMLYFGGNNGYNAFMPERLKLNDRPPPIVLTDVLKLNTHVSAAPESLHSLDLGFRDSMVTFAFAALDYSGPASNRYAYRLDGFDTDWVEAGAARQATYTHLDGGSYVFHVRAANGDGRWTDSPLSVRLNVAPPPWATWWARSAYVVVLCGLGFFLWLGQHRRMQREVAYARRLQQEVDARTAELAERNREMELANQQLREVSVTDSLTGLGNRRFLHEAMSAVIRGTSQPTPFVLMVIDLDCLKPINDQFGHEAGDAVLVQMAEILRREFRPGDLIVRWGGDEFIAVCMNCDLNAASVVAESVRSAVAKRIFRVGDGLVARTSCSIGFAPVPFAPGQAPPIDWQLSLNIADLALYEAKRDRNNWLGWGGTEKTARLPSILAELAGSPAALEVDGFLVARRRPWNPDETVDRLRALRPPAGR
jgi:diguanylate cyclase (GGDEF)-like protein